MTSFSNSKSLPGVGSMRNFHASVLAAAAGLLLVRVIVLRHLPDGFVIGDLRLADVRAHAELALHAVDNDFEVQLAHAGQDCLPGVRIG